MKDKSRREKYICVIRKSRNNQITFYIVLKSLINSNCKLYCLSNSCAINISQAIFLYLRRNRENSVIDLFSEFYPRVIFLRRLMICPKYCSFRSSMVRMSSRFFNSLLSISIFLIFGIHEVFRIRRQQCISNSLIDLHFFFYRIFF